MLGKIIRIVKTKKEMSAFREEWRKMNSHNMTYAENLFEADMVKVGVNTYGPLQLVTFGSGNCKLTIGSYCSIAHGVKFLMGGEHSYKYVSTYPFRNNIMKVQGDTYNKGDVVIADDVWIGEDTMFLSGVTVGQGAVIAAGSVVVKDIPPYAVVGGNPARVIKYRCSEERIAELLRCDYSKLTCDMIHEHEQDLYDDIETADMSWFPKKSRGIESEV